MTTYGTDLNIVGIPGRDSQDAMRSFVSGFDLEAMVQVPDNDDHTLWLSFGVRGQPAWALIHADGEVEVGFGAIGEDILAAAADA
ncbi:MAG: TlpA family protein disulfide reductase [Acidimicrobiales bacterium]